MTYTITAFLDNNRKDFTIDAESPKAATKKVVDKYGENRVLILRVKQAQQAFQLDVFSKVGAKDLEFFCRQFHALIKAGVNPLEALTAIGQETSEKKILSDALQIVVDNVRNGGALASSFKLRPKVFPVLLCNIVAAAEESGNLDKTMDMLAEYYHKQASFIGKIKQALSYPAIVAIAAVLEVLFMFTYTVPKFTTVLLSSNVPLPKMTLFLLAISAHADVIFPGLLIGIGVLIFLFKYLVKDDEVRYVLEKGLLKIPLIGKLIVRSTVANICRTMALMVKAGVTLTQVLALTEKVAGFIHLKRELRKAQDFVRNGRSLREAFGESKWVPPIGLKMISVGESSGQLDSMLDHAAQSFESDTDALMEKLPTFTEVILLVFVGAIVGFVMISIYLPIFGMYKAIAGGG